MRLSSPLLFVLFQKLIPSLIPFHYFQKAELGYDEASTPLLRTHEQLLDKPIFGFLLNPPTGIDTNRYSSPLARFIMFFILHKFIHLAYIINEQTF